MYMIPNLHKHVLLVLVGKDCHSGPKNPRGQLDEIAMEASSQLPTALRVPAKARLLFPEEDTNMPFTGFESEAEGHIHHTVWAEIVRWKQGSHRFSSNMTVVSKLLEKSQLDEAHFWLNGYVNKQSCRIRREANPQVYAETPLHSEKLTVWCALWAGGILLQKR
ncbi:hypothetical protein TNCV_4007851 [Trichonephila clavipes]|nr:hypothetical protein TNCV_4007851 [Trichonephila clavipes]